MLVTYWIIQGWSISDIGKLVYNNNIYFEGKGILANYLTVYAHLDSFTFCHININVLHCSFLLYSLHVDCDWLHYVSGDGDENSSDDDDDYSLSDQEGSDSAGDAVNNLFTWFDWRQFNTKLLSHSSLMYHERKQYPFKFCKRPYPKCSLAA